MASPPLAALHTEATPALNLLPVPVPMPTRLQLSPIPIPALTEFIRTRYRPGAASADVAVNYYRHPTQKPRQDPPDGASYLRAPFGTAMRADSENLSDPAARAAPSRPKEASELNLYEARPFKPVLRKKSALLRI